MKKRVFLYLFLFFLLFTFVFSEGLGVKYTFNVILKKGFSKKPGILEVYNYKFLFKPKYRKSIKEWYFKDVSYLEWNGGNEIKIHLKKKDVKFLFRKRKVKFIVLSPNFSEKNFDDINNIIFKFKKGGFKIDIEDVEKKLPIVLDAKHEHLIGECFGKLIISRDGIEYKSFSGEHHFDFFYNDIKDIDRSSPFELKVVIFKRNAKKMWKSEEFSFKLLKGEKISDDIFLYMRYRIGREK